MEGRAQALVRALAPLRQRAAEHATDGGRAAVTPASFALALLDEGAARDAVSACEVELEVARDLVLGTMDEEPRRRFWHLGAPSESPAMVSVLQQIFGHALSAELDTVTPGFALVHVVLAPSILAERLDAIGLEALSLKRFAAHGRVDDAPLADGTGGGRVVLYDDPFSTMEVVIDVLERFFDQSPEAAERLMRRVHERGRGGFAFRDWERARLLAAAAIRYARDGGHPLEITLEGR